jgi:hypothetical protein
MKYKKFIWFRIYTYYPVGGLGDIKLSFDTLEEAIKHCGIGENFYEEDQIVDRDTWEVVWKSESEES